MGWQNVLNAFATSGGFYELAGTLYREAFWLVSDQLGTPRMIVGKSGSLASVKRHDYLPFGEEIYAGMSGRTTTQGYTGDSVRQHFTGYEADAETGLNFAEARDQSPAQGRFASVDPLGASASVGNPQSFNRYSYVNNSPTNLTDPSGMQAYDASNSYTDAASSLEPQPFNPNRSHFGGPAVLFAAGLFHSVGTMAASQSSSSQKGSGSAGTEGKDPGHHAIRTATYSNSPFVPGEVTPPFDPELEGSPAFVEEQATMLSFPFPSQEAAAIAAEQNFNPTSIGDNLEYAGRICALVNGGFAYSLGPANRRTPVSSSPGVCPAGTLGTPLRTPTWHTHASRTSLRRPNGDLVDETFSDPDKIGANLGRSESYLGTPSGRILVFTPGQPGVPSTFGTPRELKERTRVP